MDNKSEVGGSQVPNVQVGWCRPISDETGVTLGAVIGRQRGEAPPHVYARTLGCPLRATTNADSVAPDEIQSQPVREETRTLGTVF